MQYRKFFTYYRSQNYESNFSGSLTLFILAPKADIVPFGPVFAQGQCLGLGSFDWSSFA